MNNPIISVIVPNYNHATFLDERFRSILNQTYQNFELIILDDKSTDNSIDIINKYKNNPHVSHVVINEVNSGSPFKQWNKGIQLAKGDLVWIAESDDSCSPFFLEKLVHLHISNDAILSFCRSQRMDEDCRLLSTLHNEISTDFILDGKDFIRKYLGKNNTITNASSVLFNKCVLSSIPDDYIEFKGAGDWLLWIEISRRGRVVFNSETLNYFRSHEKNTTTLCYKDGTNFYEGKRINDYLYSEGLISKEAFKQNLRSNINIICNLSFSQESVKYDLLNYWGYNFSFRFKLFISKILNKLIILLWS